MSTLLNRLLLSVTLALAPLAMAADNVASAVQPIAAAPSVAESATAVTPPAVNTPAKAQKTPVKKAVAKTPTKKKPVAKTTTQKKSSTAKTTATKKSAAKKTVANKANKANKAPAKIAAASVSTPARFDELDAYHNAAKAYMVKVGDEIIWENASEQRLPPASLTKMMTALLVVESYRPNDVVEISPEAAAETGSRIGLRAGDRLLLADVLAAALIRSANDACHALADWHSGSEAVFVARMNQRAEQLGLRNTQFKNACGLDKPGHYSTARDLAVIAETAMKNPTFARIVTKERMSFRSVDGRRTFRVKTTNHLIGTLDGIQGVKTGFTNGAGPCLVAMADRNGERVTLVMLNARNRWWNAAAMIDSAFVQGPRLVAKKHEKQSQQSASAETPAAPVTRSPDTSSAALARGV